MSGVSPKIRDLLGKPGESDASLPEDDDYVAYSHARIGNKPQVSITFRKADGSGKSFAYSYMYCLEFDDPNLGFTAEFSHTKVTVKGQNLAELVRLVSLHRVVEVFEAGRGQAMEAEGGMPCVEAILVFQG